MRRRYPMGISAHPPFHPVMYGAPRESFLGLVRSLDDSDAQRLERNAQIIRRLPATEARGAISASCGVVGMLAEQTGLHRRYPACWRSSATAGMARARCVEHGASRSRLRCASSTSPWMPPSSFSSTGRSRSATASTGGPGTPSIRISRPTSFTTAPTSLAAPARIWNKPGLSAGETEQVRLHPYRTERVLSRSEFLTTLAPVDSAHHERVDGSCSPRGASAAQGDTEPACALRPLRRVDWPWTRACLHGRRRAVRDRGLLACP